MEEEIPLTDVTAGNLYAAIAFLLGIAAILVSLDKGIEVVQKWRGVKQKQEQAQATEIRFAGIETRLSACESRLEKGDVKFDEVAEDGRHTLLVLNALLMHFISGNNHEKLKSVKTELDTYMATRR